MTEEEKIKKIEEIQMEFRQKLRALDKERTEKIATVKKDIDQRRITNIRSSLNI